MTVTSLSCPSCGGALKALPTEDFVLCSYCQSNLQVTIQDGLAQKVEILSAEIEELRLERRIRELDDRWKGVRQKLQMHGQQGPEDPNPITAKALICLAFIVPVVAISFGGVRSPIAWIIGISLGAFCYIRGAGELSLSRRFASTEAIYKRERATLGARLAEVTRSRADLRS